MTARRRRALRALLAVVTVLVLVVGLAMGAALWLVSSDAGARVVLERVGELMPGKVELGAVEGTIRGPLRQRGVVYEREGMRLTIDDLRLRWRLRALLERQVDVEELSAAGVRLTTEPAPETDTPFELPQIDLPVTLAVRRASVRDAEIALAGGEPIRIRSANLSTVSRGDTLVIDRFDVDSPDLALDVKGSLTPLGPYPVDLDVAWALAAPDGRR
jgi:translocation and assembly module TamB